MRQTPKLVLIREISSRTLQIGLQFIDTTGSTVGPRFRCKSQALDWYKRYLKALHTSHERRSNGPCRRRNSRAITSERRSQIRRQCDRPIELLDSHAELEEAIQHLLTTSADKH